MSVHHSSPVIVDSPKFLIFVTNYAFHINYNMHVTLDLYEPEERCPQQHTEQQVSQCMLAEDAFIGTVLGDHMQPDTVLPDFGRMHDIKQQFFR